MWVKTLKGRKEEFCVERMAPTKTKSGKEQEVFREE